MRRLLVGHALFACLLVCTACSQEPESEPQPQPEIGLYKSGLQVGTRFDEIVGSYDAQVQTNLANSEMANTNYGTLGTMWSGYYRGGGEFTLITARSLMRFGNLVNLLPSASPSGARVRIEQVSLHLYQDASSGSTAPVDYDLWRLNRAFSEDRVTWNTLEPPGGSWYSAGSRNITIDSSLGWKVLPISGDLMNPFFGPNAPTDYGWILKRDIEDGNPYAARRFRTAEHTAETTRPAVSIDYDCAPGYTIDADVPGPDGCKGEIGSACFSTSQCGSGICPDGICRECTSASHCSNQACVDYRCTGVCTPGALRCDGLSWQACTSSGQWQTRDNCDDGNDCTIDRCSANGCDYADVTEGSACSGGVCDGSGSCVGCLADADCTDQACVNNSCTGVCTPGDSRCNGLTPQTCGTDGQWISGDSCDDGNECTSDSCSANRCTNSPLNAGSACSTGVCDGAGACVECVDDNDCGGQACVDNACTGSCTPGDQRCQGSVPQTCDDDGAWRGGTDCDDGDVCNGTETCDAGSCVAATPLDCDTGNPCIVGSCDIVTGCQETPLGSGSGCPGGLCDGAGSCVECLADADCGEGTCDLATHTCQSGCSGGACVSCTEDVQCDDADSCTLDACIDGSCSHTGALVCGDLAGASCVNENDTDDGPEGYRCECPEGYQDDGTRCRGDDGVACSTDADCTSGHCVGGVCCAEACDDAPVCRDAEAATCPDGRSCEYAAPLPDDTACDDGIACTSDDACSAGECVGQNTCDDGDGCTEDICRADGSCEFVYACSPQARCTDERFCACTRGYEGDGLSCEPAVPPELCPAQCASNGHCSMAPDGSYRCECDEGYIGSGRICFSVTQCRQGGDDCHEDASCVQRGGEFVCRCNAGFEGDGVDGCENVDECASGAHDCDDNATCTDTQGSWFCDCNPGYVGDGSTCFEETPCTPDGDECHPLARCRERDDSYACECLDGFGGDGVTSCTPRCGDHMIGPGEECDDRNDRPGDGCHRCRIESGYACRHMQPPEGISRCSNRCGDGVVDGMEECDEGDANSDRFGATCRSHCTLAGCGDAIVDPGEACDEGRYNGLRKPMDTPRESDEGGGGSGTQTLDAGTGRALEFAEAPACTLECQVVLPPPDIPTHEQDSGCGCRVPGRAAGQSEGRTPLALWALAALLVAMRRRRGRR